MKLILFLAISVMAADTTMTGPMCKYQTKIFDGFAVSGCDWLLERCTIADSLFKDTTWYAPCKPKP